MLNTILLIILIGGCIVFILFILFLGSMSEAGFRGKFPYDFLICLSDYIKVMKDNGWEENGYSNLGSDHPSVNFTKDATCAELILNAPISGNNYARILVIKGVEVTLKDVDHLKEVIAQFNTEFKQ